MSENFGPAVDLLGDPIPENYGKRGRPPHIATQQNRQKVALGLAIGWPNERIARGLGITKATLRKHYLRELKAREEMRDRTDLALLQRCWEQVEKGNVGAMKEFGRMIERADLLRIDFARPKETEPKPEKLGKKAQAERDALEAHKGSSWERIVGDAEPPANPTAH